MKYMRIHTLSGEIASLRAVKCAALNIIKFYRMNARSVQLGALGFSVQF